MTVQALKIGQNVASVRKDYGYLDESLGFRVGTVTEIHDLLYEVDLKYVYYLMPNGEVMTEYSADLLTLDEVEAKAKELPMTLAAIMAFIEKEEGSNK